MSKGIPRVVFPEWDAPAITEARARLLVEGICTPIPVDTPTAAQAAAIMSTRDVPKPVAERMLKRPLIRAAAMVGAGDADAMVAGIEAPTRRVIEAASLAIGLASGVAIASSFFLMRFPDGQELIFADCAVTVNPDADDLSAIARASERSALALLGHADVALLSYATGTSGAGADVEKVREAAAATGYCGPIQVDAALNAAIAAKKGVAGGAANVLIFPDLDAGNIGYKLCQELAGAKAIGPVLQGFRKPVCDLSRGATADDVVAATELTLKLAR
ncbi:MAG: phosphate acyltransferase [Pseudomonadota bacterium]